MNDQTRIVVPKGVAVSIAMPIGGPNIPAKTMLSILDTVSVAQEVGVRVNLTLRTGAHVIARDGLIHDFLQHDTDKLFWIDSDMTWKPSDFLRMVAMSMSHDIVCYTYPAKTDGIPTYYFDAEEGEVTADVLGLIAVKGTGLGFTIVDRKAIEALIATKPLVTDEIANETMHEVFRFDSIDGKRRSEDMAFFADLRELGYTVWLDPHIELGHIGQREWRGRFLDALTAVE